MTNLLNLDPTKKFVQAIGKDVQKYFGKDPACIVYLQPDGTFYGVALYQWLKKKKKNLLLATMKDDGAELQEESVRGRKVLLVDNDIITGKGYKRAMEAIRERKEQLLIQDIKFAVLVDRVGLADFSVGEYSVETLWHAGDLDAVDLKLISLLAVNGRESLADLAKKTKMSSVAVKHRLDRLLKSNILKIQGAVNIERFYTLSAFIQLEGGAHQLEIVIEKCRKAPGVFYVAKSMGHHLVIGILAQAIDDISEFVEHELHTIAGLQNIRVGIAELPVIPKTIAPNMELSFPRVREPKGA